jgi:hypothetical protein
MEDMVLKNKTIVIITYLNALTADDTNIYFVDGRTIPGTQNSENAHWTGPIPTT